MIVRSWPRSCEKSGRKNSIRMFLRKPSADLSTKREAYPVVPGAPKYGILMGRREGRGKWTLNGQSALAYRIPTGISR
jgi:hypothetical protein